MTKKALAGVLVALTAVGLLLYAYQRYQHAQRRPGAAIAALAPAQALAFVATPGWPQAWRDLRRTHYFRHIASPSFWQAALGPAGYRRLLAGKQQLERHLGMPLTEQTADQWLGRDLALAVVPRQQGPWPVDVIAYAGVSATEKIAAGLARAWSPALQELVRDTQTIEGVPVVTLRLDGVPDGLSYAFLDDLAVLSTDVAWVVDAIQAHRGAAGPRLSTLAPIQAMRLAHAEALLAYGYYDADAWRAPLPAASRPTAQAPPLEVGRVLPTAGKLTLKAVRAPDGVQVEAMTLYPPGASPQAIRRTEGEGASPPFRGVPAETLYLTHIDLLDLQGLWRGLRQLAAPGASGLLERWLAEFRAAAGVDLERDVLPVFTGVVGFGITGSFGRQADASPALPGVFLTAGVTDERRARQLVLAVGHHVAGPLFSQLLTRLTYDGHELWYVGHPLLFLRPGFVISQRQLIVASEVSLLQQMLDAAQGKTTPLSETAAYREWRRHRRIKGGSVTFIDMPALLARTQKWWTQLSLLAQVLTPLELDRLPAEWADADPRLWLDLLRPIRYIGVASQGEAQGIRTEAFIALEDRR
jgi:hypothetical protein